VQTWDFMGLCAFFDMRELFAQRRKEIGARLKNKIGVGLKIMRLRNLELFQLVIFCLKLYNNWSLIF